MGRPKSYANDRVQIQIRLTPDVRDRLDAMADLRQVSKNYLIEIALAEGLAKWEAESGKVKATKPAPRKSPVKAPAKRIPVAV